MNLKRHLARLAVNQSGPAKAVEPPLDVLAELRRKMHEILDRSELEGDAVLPVSAPRELETLADLIERRETAAGPYYVRSRRFSSSERVGHQLLSPPEAIDCRMLSLLALDPNLTDVEIAGALFLDTETTGLGTGAGVFPFLIGLGWFEDGALRVEQLLASGHEQEQAILVELAGVIARSKLLITFNGKSFDWPLLEARFVMNRMRAPQAPPHLDLVHVARRIHKPRLGRCNLKVLESEVLGFERIDDISGEEVAMRYAEYLRTGNGEALRAVIVHNTFDITAMAALVSLYGDAQLPLCHGDLVGVARTLKRAHALGLAEAMCSRAISAGVGAHAYAVRGEIHHALGDRLRAVADLEHAVTEPRARLQLAKLYEHFLKRPELALELIAEGTTETPQQNERRQLRLRGKLASRQRTGASGRH